MSPIQHQQFLTEFFHFNNPQPLITPFTQEQFRSNDMKITLQIATNSNLRMQSDPKNGFVSFSCKNYGKACYEIFGYKLNNHYFIQTDFTKIKHARSCQLTEENFQYLKIYNLMKLKKDLIQNYMLQNQLINASPSQILSSISQQKEYFFQQNIKYNSELRRKLRKRFDNIINIDIKKITKGGREDLQFIQKDSDGVLKERKFFYEQNDGIKTKQNKISRWNVKLAQQIPKKKLLRKHFKGNKNRKESIARKTNFLNISEPTKKRETQQNQSIFEQSEQKQNIFYSHYNNHFPQNNIPPTYSNQYFSHIDDPIYISSESQLPEIKQLNEECNYFGDVFSWSEEEKGQPAPQIETINDKLRETVLMGMRKKI